MNTVRLNTNCQCSRCGGELLMTDTRYTCRYCGRNYDIPSAENEHAAMQARFDEFKLELIGNLRRRLYDAVTAPYISREDIKNACNDLLALMPDDPTANFYKSTVSQDIRQLNCAIQKIDIKSQYEDIGVIVTYLVRSMSSDENYLLALNDLVERTYKPRDLTQFNHYATMVSEQAARVNAGVYETCVPRDVFIAYSSKDMVHVIELVEELERQGITCFVAARNLRHGVGSVENYDRVLKEAMDNCHSIVFISSNHSRNFSCDALKIELSYIRSKDIENAPAQYRHNYETMPTEFKKPRVEYRVEESERPNAADEMTDQFFSGYERVYAVSEVAVRVARQLCESSNHSVQRAVISPDKNTSYSSDLSSERFESAPLLKRAFLFLEMGNWQDAADLCDKVLVQEPQNGEAYLCKLMVDLQVEKRDKLKNAPRPFTKNVNYIKAMRFGNETLVRMLHEAAQKQYEQYQRQKAGKKAVNNLLTFLFVLILLVAAFIGLVCVVGISTDPILGIIFTLICAVPIFFAIRGIILKKKKLKQELREMNENQ